MSGSLSPQDLCRLADSSEGRTGRQSEFAAFVGWDKSHVTRLKQLGQLVLDTAGLVDFAPSLRRIAEHADPARDAQRQVAAQRRGGAAAPVAEAPAPSAEASGSGADSEVDGPKYSESRATKEYWAAQTAKVEYERLVGDLVRRADVDKAVADAAMQFRQAIENQPHRLADRLVGLDLDAMREMLRQDGQLMLGELTRGLARRLAALHGSPAAPNGSSTGQQS